MAPKGRSADIIRVQHMAQAVEEVLIFTTGKTRGDLSNDRVLTLAIIKDIEILGEAASQVSEQFQNKFSEIPWRHIIATRHRLIHGYFDIDLDIVWETITRDLPELNITLKKSLKVIKE